MMVVGLARHSFALCTDYVQGTVLRVTRPLYQSYYRWWWPPLTSSRTYGEDVREGEQLRERPRERAGGGWSTPTKPSSTSNIHSWQMRHGVRGRPPEAARGRTRTRAQVSTPQLTSVPFPRAMASCLSSLSHPNRDNTSPPAGWQEDSTFIGQNPPENSAQFFQKFASHCLNTPATAIAALCEGISQGWPHQLEVLLRGGGGGEGAGDTFETE